MMLEQVLAERPTDRSYPYIGYGYGFASSSCYPPCQKHSLSGSKPSPARSFSGECRTACPGTDPRSRERRGFGW